MRFILRIILPVFIAFIASSCKDGSHSDAVTSVWEGRKQLPDGREYRWYAGGQSLEDSDNYRVLVIEYFATPGKERHVLKHGVTYSTSDPLPDMNGSASVIHAWPADADKSGLAVNGVKQKLDPGLNVVLISNLHEISRFIVLPNEVEAYMESLRKEDWDVFFTAKMLPHLPQWKTPQY